MTAANDFVPYCLSIHDVGRWRLSVDNCGRVGLNWSSGTFALYPDCITGNVITHPSEYPKGARNRFLSEAGLWVGGVVGDDTLVTTVADFGFSWESVADWVSGKPLIGRSTLDSNDVNYWGAVSEQDRIVAYTDTFIDYSLLGYGFSDYLDHRPHKPIGLRFVQESYAWSYSYADDIVYFNVNVRNIGKLPVRAAYIGLFVEPAVEYVVMYDQLSRWGSDDLTGFLQSYPVDGPCDLRDTLNLAWTCDNDGDPFNDEWLTIPVFDPVTHTTRGSNRQIMGVSFLSDLTEWQTLSYNWWVGKWDQDLDYGPMRVDHYRDLRTGGGGTPWGDRNRYYVMSNGEIDYDQVYTAVMRQDDGWTHPPPNNRGLIACGSNVDFLLSIGPLDIGPGQVYTFTYCVVGGENFHLYPINFANLPYHPDRWRAQVDFSDLAKNAVWAQKIYDNPGYDTDGDGYAGEYRICNYDSVYADGTWRYTAADTEWYKGDGVPDFRAAGPPPPPDFWLTPIHNGIHVRFNGQVTETAKDALTQQIDFEGYRVHIARDSRAASYSVVASYDLDDYDKMAFNPNLAQGANYELRGRPLRIEELRCLYGGGPDPCADSSFDPLAYSRVHPYVMPGYPDSVFFFLKHDYNVSDLGVTTPIRKIYPNVPDPRLLPPDSITDDMYTDDGYLKFYDYEFTIENLLPSVPYWVNVTTFDFGSPEAGLEPLESSVTLQAQSAYPLHDLDASVSGSDRVYVYPNPYRLDAEYRGAGLEGREMEDRSDDRVRAIWFANLPPKCTITIFTLDGDRVRTLEHDFAPGDPMGSHHRWDLINRNMQRVVSGLYYWTVEFPDRETQIGKLVIIR